MRTFTRRILSLLLCLAVLASLAACGADVPSSTLPVSTPPVSESPAPVDPPEPVETTEPAETPDPVKTPEPPPVTDTPQPSPEQTPAVSDSPSPEVTPPVESTDPPEETAPVVEGPVYSFGTPLEETEPVEDTHFDTAVFLGDSRTEGLQLFGGIRHGDYYWARGMTVFRVDDPNAAVFEIDGEMDTMVGALGLKQYESVYIMVGVNELGYPASSYEEGLSVFIDQVLEAQPNAVVYLQILPPVNEEVAKANGLANYINNTNIGKFNEAIVRIAAQKKVVLLDTAEVYRDENGSLPAEMASDGCHFNFGDYRHWANYLRNHVMDPELYHASRGTAEEPAPVESPETETEQEAPQ